jgi:hypothetical protein
MKHTIDRLYPQNLGGAGNAEEFLQFNLKFICDMSYFFNVQLNLKSLLYFLTLGSLGALIISPHFLKRT